MTAAEVFGMIQFITENERKGRAGVRLGTHRRPGEDDAEVDPRELKGKPEQFARMFGAKVM